MKVGDVLLGGLGLGAAMALSLSLAADRPPAWTGTAVCSPSLAAEQTFLDENAAAMDRMMTGMAARPRGDIDRDFVAMMTPHHQGAIDMAVAYLRYGQNAPLRRLAQEIIVEQQQEIAAMVLATGAPPPTSTPAPTNLASPRDAAGARRPESHQLMMSPTVEASQ